jgi:gliding motility-associated-like protein
MPIKYRSLILIFLFLFCFLTNTEAALKHHKVTVGMYNTYSVNDGNLGNSKPDLKEVWEGDPNTSGYEACNMTMHYWPRPYDLPIVENSQNPYTQWWKDYMEEAYNLTNQNGEVRLKVIIGPLYSYYEIYKGDIFNDFIKDLCLWEKGNKYEGTLAGWYVAEEPMGSSHNFYPDVCNNMIDDIKAVEKSAGIQHKIYIDVALDGQYYNPEKLVEFTRQTDVVMISASTYLWTTSPKQPVYDPNWNSIHGPMKIARDLIYPDRNRRKVKRPEIHVVLESRDAIGYGQPTNWEMRQQINLALSQSVPHNDPPADGIWFFWWSEIGKNAKDDKDDWNNGRRLAEAIQIQVPRSTFAESSSTGKSDPEKTRFRFPQSGSFNPNNSCIPYDLAESGNVRIEILTERKSRVKKFDMNYQVAGSLTRFGGPYWEKGNNMNGNYIFLLYVNSKLMDEVKVKVQWIIMLNSASHQPGVWSQNNVVDIQWEPEPEEIREIQGYSIAWDNSEFGSPDLQIDIPPEITSIKSDPLPDGNNHYFHINSTDGVNYWSPSASIGPFYIDTNPPGSVKDIASDSHQIGKWSKDNIIKLHWNPSEDAMSGLKGYSILWDGSPGTIPDDKIDISAQVTLLASQPLSDGKHYFHIRSVDIAGNWSDSVVHIGPFLIDTLPPNNVTSLASNSHVIGKWSNNDTVAVNWNPALDETSGIEGYSIILDNLPDTIPNESINLDGVSSTIIKLKSGKDNYFHIRGVDKADNWNTNAQHLGPFMIDTQPPPKIPQLTLVSHKSDEWSSLNSVIIKWESVKDDLSGINSYQWFASHNKEIDAGASFKPATNPLQITQLDDGVWYIYVRASDNAGNIGESEHAAVKIDTQPPDPPEIKSASHPDSSVWYTNPDMLFSWTAEDKLSGISGYIWSWDMNESAIPTEQTPLKSIQLKSSTSGVWYFHILAVDNAGNKSKVSNYKVQIDPSAPSSPKILSDSYKSGDWSTRNDIRLMWEIPEPSSGIPGYSYLLDHSPSSIPEEIIIDHTGKVEYTNLSDGIWFFHCRAKSGSGLWGDTGHFEIRIDTTPPQLSITYPESDKWYNHPITEYSGTVSDNASGVDWDRFFYQLSSDKTQFHSDIQGKNWSDKDEIPHIDEGTAIFIITIYDKAGNYSVSQPVNIRIDHSISAPNIMNLTHPEQYKWYKNNSPEISWSATDGYSGIEGYSWIIDQSETTVPKENKMTDANNVSIKDLSDGIWYFHVRALDKAGNWSETAHYKIKIDATSPTVQLKLSGQAVTTGDIVKSGFVDVSLTASEPIFDPVLKYKPSSAISSIPIKLTGSGTEWKGSFDVTIHTGDGDAKFFFYCVDQASNSGDRITEGDSFRIDTLIHADSSENSQVLCLSELGTKLSLPVGAINQDMRIEIKKSEATIGTIAVYDFIAYDSQMRWIRDARFKTPVEITFDEKYNVFNPSVYYWDGVKWNRIRDSIAGVRVDYLGRFALINPSSAELSTTKCWAAPNPFTPNGSKDETDRTIFHIVTKDNSADFTINIYDVNGRLIKHIENGNKVWDGTDDRGRIVEGGLYIFQVHLATKIMSGTVVVLK